MTKQIWIRSTYFDPGKGAVTTVASKGDLNEDIHVFANEMREKFGRRVDVEIFEWDDDLISASAEAHRRAQKRIPDEEHFRNTLHDFLIAMFIKVPPTKTIAPSHAAPVSTADIKAIFEKVKQHPEYKSRGILVTSEDGGTVLLKAGDITVR